MDQEDQRDHAEEAANRAAMEAEAREEEAAETAERAAIIKVWRYADVHHQVALVNMTDVYVRAYESPLAKRLMVIMVSALHGIDAGAATVIVDAEITSAQRRRGF